MKTFVASSYESRTKGTCWRATWSASPSAGAQVSSLVRPFEDESAPVQKRRIADAQAPLRSERGIDGKINAAGFDGERK